MSIPVGKYPKFEVTEYEKNARVDRFSQKSTLVQKIKAYTPKEIFIIICIATVYYSTAKLGLRLAFLHPSATPIWAPTGIAIASLLIWGYRVWPGVFLGAFFANVTTEGTILTSIGIATGNTLEGIVASFVVNRFIGLNNAFTRAINIFKYTVLVALISTMVSASMGAMSLLLGGFITLENYTAVWTTWWLGDAGGALIIAPLILLWVIDHKFNWTFKLTLEAIILTTVLVVINAFVFIGVIPQAVSTYPLAFISLPVLIWIAFRFRPRETVTAVFILLVIAVYGTLNQVGPFFTQNLNQSLLTIQIYIGIIFLGVMPLAAESWEQRKTEAALRESAGKYKKLIETSPDAILVSDLTGNIRVVNHQTLRMYGLKNRSEIVGKSGFDFVAPEDREKTQDALSKILDKGRITNLEYLSLRKNGIRFNASANASLLLDSSGNPEGIVIVSRDISKKKEIEKMKSEFVSLASHQLRTPLGSMRWSIEMLLKGDYGDLPKPLKSIVRGMYDSLIRLIQLVNDLLDVSRIEEGRILNNPERVNVASLIKKIVSSFSPLAQKKDVEIIFERPRGHMKQLTIDKGKLTDVIENLLSNSIKYIRHKGKVVVILEKGGKGINIRFKDSGIGIPKKYKGKIFTKFFRSDEAMGMETEGTGLGLFIVKSYVEEWGGKIDFESTPGKGSVFSVDIPFLPKVNGNVKNDHATK